MGYITSAGYTLLKSELQEGIFLIIMVKFLLPYIASKCIVFSVLDGLEWPLGQVEIAATGSR